MSPSLQALSKTRRYCLVPQPQLLSWKQPLSSPLRALWSNHKSSLRSQARAAVGLTLRKRYISPVSVRLSALLILRNCSNSRYSRITTYAWQRELKPPMMEMCPALFTLRSQRPECLSIKRKSKLCPIIMNNSSLALLHPLSSSLNPLRTWISSISTRHFPRSKHTWISKLSNKRPKSRHPCRK